MDIHLTTCPKKKMLQIWMIKVKMPFIINASRKKNFIEKMENSAIVYV